MATRPRPLRASDYSKVSASTPHEAPAPSPVVADVAPESAPKAPGKKAGRPALDPSGSLALHFRIPGNAGAALTRAAGSGPGARSALARRLLLAAMAQAGISFTSEDEGEGTLPMPFAVEPQT
jgi:hypothetical protein